MDWDLYAKAEAIVAEIKASDEYQKALALLESMKTKAHLSAKVQAFTKAKTAYEETARFGKHHPDLPQRAEDLIRAKTVLHNEATYQEYLQAIAAINGRLADFSERITAVLADCTIADKKTCHKG